MSRPADCLTSFELESNFSYQPFEGANPYRYLPTRLSLPLPAGTCRADHWLTLTDDTGRAIPCVTRPFLFWPDGSVRVCEIWFPTDLQRGERRIVAIRRATGPGPALPPPADLAEPQSVTVTAILDDGSSRTAKVGLDTRGDSAPCRRFEHDFILGEGERPLFRGTIVRRRWSWYAGAEWQFRLTQTSADEVLTVRGLRLETDLSGSGQARYTVRQATLTAVDHPRLLTRDNVLHVQADGNGLHVADPRELGENELDYPPYERGPYLGAVGSWLAMSDAAASWLLVVPDAMERMPKGWSVDGHRLIVDLHPTAAEPLAWRQGMTLYQRLVLHRLPATATPAELESEAQAWLRPPIVRLEADAYRAAGWRIPFQYRPERFPKTEFHFRDTFNFAWNRGTFHWGDQLAADKGGQPATPGKRAMARNLEYDFVAVAAKEYARTGVGHLWRLCQASAEHMMYTDFVAVSDDPWKEGGIVHHSYDHTSGSAYPSHMWAEGLTLYYQLTGDPQALYTARRVGDFYLKYIHERFQVVQGTGREVGWTLIALAAVYDLTREERYLDGIRRVVDHNLEQGWHRFFPCDATFTIGVAIVGFDRTREFHRDADTRQFIHDLLEWMMRDRRDAIGLFEYWRDPEQGAIPYVQTHLPEALNIGYRLFGDEGYLRAAWRLYQINLEGGPLTVQPRHVPFECGYAAGHHISWSGCLQSFADKGWLDQLQYREPE